MVPVNRLPCCRIAYPETKKGAFNQHTKVLNANLANSKPTFVEDTMNKTKESTRSIYRSITRAEKIIPEAKAGY